LPMSDTHACIAESLQTLELNRKKAPHSWNFKSRGIVCPGRLHKAHGHWLHGEARSGAIERIVRHGPCNHWLCTARTRWRSDLWSAGGGDGSGDGTKGRRHQTGGGTSCEGLVEGVRGRGATRGGYRNWRQARVWARRCLEPATVWARGRPPQPRPVEGGPCPLLDQGALGGHRHLLLRVHRPHPTTACEAAAQLRRPRPQEGATTWLLRRGDTLGTAGRRPARRRGDDTRIAET